MLSALCKLCEGSTSGFALAFKKAAWESRSGSLWACIHNRKWHLDLRYHCRLPETSTISWNCPWKSEQPARAEEHLCRFQGLQWRTKLFCAPFWPSSLYSYVMRLKVFVQRITDRKCYTRPSLNVQRKKLPMRKPASISQSVKQSFKVGRKECMKLIGRQLERNPAVHPAGSGQLLFIQSLAKFWLPTNWFNNNFKYSCQSCTSIRIIRESLDFMSKPPAQICCLGLAWLACCLHNCLQSEDQSRSALEDQWVLGDGWFWEEKNLVGQMCCSISGTNSPTWSPIIDVTAASQKTKTLPMWSMLHIALSTSSHP